MKQWFLHNFKHVWQDAIEWKDVFKCPYCMDDLGDYDGYGEQDED